jgi:hypothetical protein
MSSRIIIDKSYLTHFDDEDIEFLLILSYESLNSFDPRYEVSFYDESLNNN